jgi:hypothetical protein
MRVSGNGGSNYQPPEAGTWSAVCTRIIDLGTQTSEWKGKPKKARKVLLGWELDQKMGDGRPFLVTSRFTASIHEKATLGKFLEGWRGRAFTDEERAGFDLHVLLGQPCLLNLVKNGDYTNVASASKMPRGMAPLQPEGSLTLLDLDNFSRDVYDTLSEGLKATIAKSPEYDKATGGQGIGAGMDTPHGDGEEVIPF